MMAEKSKKVNEELRAENDKLFLERNQVKETIGELINILTANRPANPLQFMADYFRSTFEQTNKLERSYQTILLTHHSRPAFQRNVTIAFEILNQTKLAKNVHGINGALYGDLLDLLLQDLPGKIIPKLKSKLSYQPHIAVSFEAFHYGVTSVMVFKDFIEMAGQLFQVLNVNGADQIDKTLAESLIHQLKSSFVDLKADATMQLQTCYSLSPDGLYPLVSEARKTDSSGSRPLFSYEKFLESCTDAYLVILEQNS